MENLNHLYLILSLLLFGIGILGVVLQRSAILILMSIELMLNAINLIFVAFGSYYQTLDPQISVFFIMVVAAAEVATGLAILAALFTHHRTLDIDFWSDLKK